MNLASHTNPLLIDVPMPVTTPRLLIRPVTTGDGAVIHAMKDETWDELLQWMPWAQTEDGERTAETCEAVVREAYAEFILRKDMTMIGFERNADGSTGRAVLMTGLHRFCWKLRGFEIGFWVAKSAQGKGYATETANALTRFAFGALSARRVTITHAGGNDRSRNVIEKLGFTLEATRLKDAMFPNGTIMDHYDYVRFDTNNLPDLDVRW